MFLVFPRRRKCNGRLGSEDIDKKRIREAEIEKEEASVRKE
jgi:hypothetical protein